MFSHVVSLNQFSVTLVTWTHSCYQLFLFRHTHSSWVMPVYFVVECRKVNVGVSLCAKYIHHKQSEHIHKLGAVHSFLSFENRPQSHIPYDGPLYYLPTVL
eukprot:TRINITY_DN13807_c1_g1_i1.p2 TRINITY_DN13807_c1_g1~~TRINITY_DN13807_c1_g1_i1.p2  ORF type:complete len:101 (-),score=4.01 TRINITY_DN13807_c1_g1_i1:608-910(-)